MGDCLRFLILWEIGCTTNKAMFGLGMNVRTVELWQVRTMDVAGSWGGIKEKYRLGLSVRAICAILCITKDGSDDMVIKIDFNSDEALYMQLRNQIIVGIATSQIQEGESLPSVRQLADTVGINMHTVNKAYTLLKQEGFIKLDRRKGAVISLDVHKLEALVELEQDLRIVLARGRCHNITKEEVHQLIDDIYMEYE